MDHLGKLVGDGSGGLDVETLRACIHRVRGGPLSDFAMTKSDPVLKRIGDTLAEGGEEEKTLGLELAALISKNFANAEGLLYMLEEAGESLEKFTARHVDLDGHRDKPDDEIYRNLLTLLICSAEGNFRGAQLLELVDNKMSTAFAALSALFRAPFGHAPMDAMLKSEPILWDTSAQLITCGIKVLCDFTTCDTYFQSSDTRNYGDIDIHVLNKEFTQNVAQVSRALLQYPILDLITVHLEEWFQIVRRASMDSMKGFLRMCGTSPQTRLRPLDDNVGRLMMYLEAGVASSLMMISNLLTYTNEYSAQLRKFVANHTIFIQNLILPYVCFLCTVLEAAEVQGAENDSESLNGCVRQILYIIKVLSFVTFRVKAFRSWFRERNFTARLLKSKILLDSNLRGHVVALLARLNVNVDAADATHAGWPETAALFEKVWEGTSERGRQRVSSVLCAPAETMYPVNKFCKTYKHLAYMWTHGVLSGGGADSGAAGELPPEDDEYDSSDDDQPNRTPRKKFRFDADEAPITFQPYSSRGIGRGRGGWGKRGGRGRGRSHWAHRHQRQRHVRQLLEKRWSMLRKGKNNAAGASGNKGVKGFVFDDAKDAAIDAPATGFGFDGGSFGEAAAAVLKGGDAADAKAAVGGGCPFGETDSDTDDEVPTAAAAKGGAASADDAKAPAAPVTAPPSTAVLEIPTDKIRANLVASSRPTASPPTSLFKIKDAPPAFSLGGAALGNSNGGGLDTTVNMFKPTRLAPLGGGHLPKGVEMNSMFGDEKKGVLGSDAVAREEPTQVTRIIWEPETEVARAATGGDGEEDGGAGGSAAIPPAFLCALTHQLVRNPVISPYGDVFERNAILRWFKENGNTCPVTQKPLEVTDLVLDHDLRRDIDEYRLKTRMEAVAE